MILGGALKPLRRRRLIGALPERIPVSGSVAALSGMLGMTLVSAGDERSRFDSPGDLPGGLEYADLAAQTRFVVALIQHLIDANIDMSPEGGSDSFGRLDGRVVSWGPHSYQPDEPVAGALVRVRTFRVRTFGKATVGVRADPLAMTGDDGRFTVTGLEARTLYLKPAHLEAYVVDPASGKVVAALDRGPLGIGKYPAEVIMDDLEKKCTLVTFPCAGVTLFDLVDPRRLAVLDQVRILESGKVVPRRLDRRPLRESGDRPPGDRRNGPDLRAQPLRPPGRRYLSHQHRRSTRLQRPARCLDPAVDRCTDRLQHHAGKRVRAPFRDRDSERHRTRPRSRGRALPRRSRRLLPAERGAGISPRIRNRPGRHLRPASRADKSTIRLCRLSPPWPR